MSASDCENPQTNDVPKADDEVTQLGNDTDTDRQSAIMLSTVGSDAPCVKLFQGIDSYVLSGKDVVSYGYDKAKGNAYLRCYGDTYIGDPDGSTYVKYDRSQKKMDVKAALSVLSTIGDKTIDQYIKDVVPPVTQEDIEGYVNTIVDPKFEGIQNQIDGVIETWFYNGVPTLSSYPVSEWNTEELKIQHLGDLYYDNDTGTAYRFSQKADKTYYWNTITDDAITKALAAAKKAQDTADGKRRVFTSQPTAQDEYDAGDLWVNATYPADGTQYSNDILRCVTAKAAGAAFSILHWTLASKYTDDTALNNFITGYEKNLADIQAQIDGKAETWYQANDPSTAWDSDEKKASHKGDLWYNTGNSTTWFWNGTAWEKQDVPSSVFDAIDGKADIFVSKPTAGYHVNDLWFLEADYTLSGVDYKAGTLVVAKQDSTTWNAAHWVKKDRYTDDTLAQAAKTAADNAKTAADNAKADAKAANDRLTAWANDGVISPTEKQGIKDEIARIDGDKSHITAEYAKYKLGTPEAYNSAHSAYRAILVTLSAATPENITIPADFATKQTTYYAQRTAALNAISVAADSYAKSLVDALDTKLVDKINDYEYLKEAFKGASISQGGLFLSSYIKLGEWDLSDPDNPIMQKVWSGHNGLYNNAKTVASFWGGDMVDRYYEADGTERSTPLTKDFAAALLRMDGSGYLANGNIKWNELGAVTISEAVTFNIANVKGLSDSLSSINSYINGMNNLFVAVENNAAHTEHAFSWAQANADKVFAIKAKKSFYTDGELSAKGVGSGSSGSGSAYGLLREWPVSDPGDNTNDALGANLGWDLYTRIQSLQANGSLNETQLAQYLTKNNYAKKSDIPSLAGYATQSWVSSNYQPKGNYLTAITKAQVEAVLTGNITSHTHSQYLTSHQALDYLNVKDVRGATRNPDYFTIKNASFWFNNSGTPSGAWYSGLHVKGWANTYASWEICANSDTVVSANAHPYFRIGVNST